MCLNQILKDEQLVLMEHVDAANLPGIRKHRRKLSLFVEILKDHPYAHRPFSSLNGHGWPSVPKASGPPRLSSGVAAWENEGGLVKQGQVAKSQRPRGSPNR